MMYMPLRDANERDTLLFGEPYNSKHYPCGVENFEIDLGTARLLINLGYLEPDETQNNSPTAQEMIDFCLEHEGDWYLHGYAVSPEREDFRVTLDGVGSRSWLSMKSELAFFKFFRYADELEADAKGAYCWYD